MGQIITDKHGAHLVIVAQGLRPNSRHDAYAVWLYNTQRDARLLGFAPRVRRNGRLQTSGRLPGGAGCYRSLIVSRETSVHPHAPHRIALSGTLLF